MLQVARILYGDRNLSLGDRYAKIVQLINGAKKIREARSSR
ncbi:MAG: hypothetical protein QNJ32_28420 [Xenococcaceae cyanobacterium MO_167.B27]|nr:hypothetical protein [Xenococcaceae cyanobacterium MO_167.B27]